MADRARPGACCAGFSRARAARRRRRGARSRISPPIGWLCTASRRSAPCSRGAGRSGDRVAPRLRWLGVAPAAGLRRHHRGRRRASATMCASAAGRRSTARACAIPIRSYGDRRAAGGVSGRRAARAARDGGLANFTDAERRRGRAAARHDLPDRAHAAGAGGGARRRALRQPRGVRRRRVRLADPDHFGDRSAAGRSNRRPTGRGGAGALGRSAWPTTTCTSRRTRRSSRRSFLLDEDGVLRDLLLDYGDFRWSAALEKLEITRQRPTCQARGLERAIAAEPGGAPYPGGVAVHRRQQRVRTVSENT